ncbi:MAG: flavin reductase family protein, partial [bacterium]
MKRISPSEIKDNSFNLIGKSWMLVSAGNLERINCMTASWGG